MIRKNKMRWVRAFIDQAKLDQNLAESLFDILSDTKLKGILRTNSRLYTPAVYAYSQQAIEKALKALLWYEKGHIDLIHNPMDAVLELDGINERNSPTHLAMISRNKEPLKNIVNMAPGAYSPKRSIKMNTRQSNTEYPFESSDGTIKLPYEEISMDDLGAVFKVNRKIIPQIVKYLETTELAPSNIFSN